jgi:hypothetical protein
MRTLSILLAVFSIPLSVPACAQQGTPEPYSVKVDKLGETLSEWQANHNPRELYDLT